jgi:hypothetical protein
MAALRAVGRVLSRAVWMIAALGLGAFSARIFREHALRSGNKLMYAAGQFAVLAGYRYEAYRAIDGR